MVSIKPSMSTPTSTRSTSATTIPLFDTGGSRTTYNAGVLSILAGTTVLTRQDKGIKTVPITFRIPIALYVVPMLFCSCLGFGSSLPILRSLTASTTIVTFRTFNMMRTLSLQLGLIQLPFSDARETVEGSGEQSIRFVSVRSSGAFLSTTTVRFPFQLTIILFQLVHISAFVLLREKFVPVLPIKVVPILLFPGFVRTGTRFIFLSCLVLSFQNIETTTSFFTPNTYIFLILVVFLATVF